MVPDEFDHLDVVNTLSGILALCDVTVSQIGNRARSRPSLMMIRKSVGKLLQTELPEEPDCDPQRVGNKLVLVIDEDILALTVLEHELRRMGAMVLGAQSVDNACRMLELVDQHVDLVLWGVHDATRPPPAGEQFERSMPVTYLADHAGCGMIERPLEPRELRRTLCGLLSSPVPS